MGNLNQRIARLERVARVQTETEADGVVVYMPWEERSRALAAMRHALERQPYESLDVHGMAIALLCWGEGVTPHDLVLTETRLTFSREVAKASRECRRTLVESDSGGSERAPSG